MAGITTHRIFPAVCCLHAKTSLRVSKDAEHLTRSKNNKTNPNTRRRAKINQNWMSNAAGKPQILPWLTANMLWIKMITSKSTINASGRRCRVYHQIKKI